MIMEDNTKLIMSKIWRKMLLPSVFGYIGIYVAFSLSTFFLVAKYCDKNDLVVFSMFMPLLQLRKAMEAFWADGSLQHFSMLKGAGRKEDAQKFFAEVVTGYTLLSFLIYGLLVWQMPCLVQILNLKEELREIGIAFGTPCMIYFFVSSFTVVLMKYLNGDGMPRSYAVLNLTASILMLVLQTIFIGCLKWKLNGILWAGFLTDAITLIPCLYIFLFSRQSTIRIRFRLPQLQSLRSIWNFSCGTLIKTIISFAGNILVMRWILAEYGSGIVAVFALGLQLNSMSHAFSRGYLDTIQLLTCMFRGEQNFNGLFSVWRHGFRSGLRTQIIILTILFILVPWIVEIMPAVREGCEISEAVYGLRIMILFVYLDFPMAFRLSFYNACGHSVLVSLCSFCNEVIVHISSAALFVFLHVPKHYFWYGWALDCTGQYLMVLLLAEITRRLCHYPTRHLLDFKRQRCDPSIFFVIRDNPQDFLDYRQMLELFIRHNGLPESKLKRAKLLFEELFIFAGEKMKNKARDFFFLNVRLSDSRKLCITMHYDSSESCLNSCLNTAGYDVPVEKIAGAKILRGLTDRMVIDRVLGINVVQLELGNDAGTD